MSKTDELISKYEKLILKIKMFWDISKIRSIETLESEISSLKEQIKKEEQCYNIYDKVMEAWKSESKSFEELEQTPDLDCGIYEEKHNPDFIGFDVLKQNSDIRFEQTLKDIKENMSKSSGMREFVISQLHKGIRRPNPMTPSEMRVLILCCKYHESHE